jgi:hypothetical protein
MDRQPESRSHLDFQVGMLSERKQTTKPQMFQKQYQYVGVNVDSSKLEVESFSETTGVDRLAGDLEISYSEE